MGSRFPEKGIGKERRVPLRAKMTCHIRTVMLTAWFYGGWTGTVGFPNPWAAPGCIPSWYLGRLAHLGWLFLHSHPFPIVWGAVCYMFEHQCSFISPASFPISSSSSQGNIIKRAWLSGGKELNKLWKCSDNEWDSRTINKPSVYMNACSRRKAVPRWTVWPDQRPDQGHDWRSLSGTHVFTLGLSV